MVGVINGVLSTKLDKVDLRQLETSVAHIQSFGDFCETTKGRLTALETKSKGIRGTYIAFLLCYVIVVAVTCFDTTV